MDHRIDEKVVQGIQFAKEFFIHQLESSFNLADQRGHLRYIWLRKTCSRNIHILKCIHL
ncbi:unnamed protein product [Nesidiocoris tenuis]|uniref:Uncharacterized protein n=1 Tax=Nesidiocoris tenuis TaxID=355587 RepID=A0A6H5H7N3_9HEMI|nr:unnamed protein product [Nesidiocoris tenuis]